MTIIMLNVKYSYAALDNNNIEVLRLEMQSKNSGLEDC